MRTINSTLSKMSSWGAGYALRTGTKRVQIKGYRIQRCLEFRAGLHVGKIGPSPLRNAHGLSFQHLLNKNCPLLRAKQGCLVKKFQCLLLRFLTARIREESGENRGVYLLVPC
jgi:hypothetical protein